MILIMYVFTDCFVNLKRFLSLNTQSLRVLLNQVKYHVIDKNSYNQKKNLALETKKGK